ncbi:MAG: tetratricopeptide repeat protein [Elusimicrobiota bacterium]
MLKIISNKKHLALLILAVAVTAAAYFPSLFNGFTNWDDGVLLTENSVVKVVNARNIAKIFTGFINNEYRPLLYLSFMVEHAVVKLTPFVYHLNSLLLHLLNCGLAFLFIYILTGKNAVAAFIAATFFGVHPVQVQAVAWVAGRDDVLYCVTYLLSLIMYLKYIENPSQGKYYTYSIICFYISIMSKTSAVTLPLILFLIDYWYGKKIDKSNILEKLPYFAGVLFFGVMAALAQLTNEVPRTKLMRYNFSDNVLGTFDDFVFYFNKMFYPNDLSCFYAEFRLEKEKYISVFLVLVTLLIVGATKKVTKKIVFGSLFFLITLAPVLKMTTGRPTSDHRLYLSLLGVTYLLGELFSWLYYALHANEKVYENIKKGLVITIAACITLTLGYLTWERTKVWKDSIVLWTDAINKNPFLFLAYSNRSHAYMELGQYDKAIEDCNKIIEMRIGYADAVRQIGDVYSKLKKYDKAEEYYAKLEKVPQDKHRGYVSLGDLNRAKNQTGKALEYYSKAVDAQTSALAEGNKEDTSPAEAAYAYNNRGTVYYELGDYNRAVEDFTSAITLNSRYYEAYTNRGMVYAKLGKAAEAMNDYHRSVKLNPYNETAYYNRGNLFLEQKKLEDAIRDYTTAIKYNGTLYEARLNRGDAYADTGDYIKAVKDYTFVIQSSETANAYNHRGIAYSVEKEYEKALKDFDKATKLDPGYADAYYNRGLMYYETAKYENAIKDFTIAIKFKPGMSVAYKNRGNCYFKIGHYSSAITEYTKAIQLTPEDLSANNNRLSAYIQLRDYKRAKEDLRFLKSRNYPVSPEIVEFLKKY